MESEVLIMSDQRQKKNLSKRNLGEQLQTDHMPTIGLENLDRKNNRTIFLWKAEDSYQKNRSDSREEPKD